LPCWKPIRGTLGGANCPPNLNASAIRFNQAADEDMARLTNRDSDKLPPFGG